MMGFELFDVVLVASLISTLLLLALFLTQQPEPETIIDRKERGAWLFPSRLIRQAGLPSKKSSGLYWSLKCFFTMCAVLAASELYQQVAPLVLVAMLIYAFFCCDVVLWLKRKRRQQQITHSMSMFLSMMIVYLRSGFGLSTAFQQAAQIGLEKGDPLGTELLLLAKEIRSGKERSIAFHDLAERTGLEGLRRLSLVVDVGLKMGAPIIQTLMTHQESLKQDKWRVTTDKINRKSLEVMLPMAMISLPMFIILVFFPAGVQVISLLSLMSQTL